MQPSNARQLEQLQLNNLWYPETLYIFIFIRLEKVEKRKNLTVQITQIILSYLNHATVPVNLSCRFLNNAIMRQNILYELMKFLTHCVAGRSNGGTWGREMRVWMKFDRWWPFFIPQRYASAVCAVALVLSVCHIITLTACSGKRIMYRPGVRPSVRLSRRNVAYQNDFFLMCFMLE